MTEIEAILNDRPLTYVSASIDDFDPLTPSHLLYGTRITSLPHPDVEDDQLDDPIPMETMSNYKRMLHV